MKGFIIEYLIFPKNQQNLIFFSSFISSKNIRQYTIFQVKNISFKCIKIAYLNESKLSESEVFIFRENLKNFYVPEIITLPVNEGIMKRILEFLNGTPYILDNEWFGFYKINLYRYKILTNQLI
jgi:hypothetical protein